MITACRETFREAMTAAEHKLLSSQIDADYVSGWREPCSRALICD